MCKQVGITLSDLENMTIGMCIDFIDEYLEYTNPKKKEKARKATQDDFDAF